MKYGLVPSSASSLSAASGISIATYCELVLSTSSRSRSSAAAAAAAASGDNAASTFAAATAAEVAEALAAKGAVVVAGALGVVVSMGMLIMSEDDVAVAGVHRLAMDICAEARCGDTLRVVAAGAAASVGRDELDELADMRPVGGRARSDTKDNYSN